MATRLLSLNQMIVVYRSHSLKALSSHLRLFSSQNRGSSESSEQPSNPSQVESENGSKWLNIRAGIFGPDDERLPLPGDVGLSHHLNSLEMNFSDDNSHPSFPIVKGISTLDLHKKDPTTSYLPHRGVHSLLSNQDLNLQDMTSNHPISTDSKILLNNMQESSLECKVQKCPDLLKKDFQTLFPNLNFTRQPMTVMTLCQRTVNDMSRWSEEVEEEREELLIQFVESARRICDALREEEYWADFIDPSSGRPFLGPFTNVTFFETDERYRHLGFTIDDLGCCKVISHRSWGSHIFVGALFTTAPVNSEVIDQALRSSNIEFASS